MGSGVNKGQDSRRSTSVPWLLRRQHKEVWFAPACLFSSGCYCLSLYVSPHSLLLCCRIKERGASGSCVCFPLSLWLTPPCFFAHMVKIRLICGEIRVLVPLAVRMCLCQLLPHPFRLRLALPVSGGNWVLVQSSLALCSSLMAKVPNRCLPLFSEMALRFCLVIRVTGWEWSYHSHEWINEWPHQGVLSMISGALLWNYLHLWLPAKIAHPLPDQPLLFIMSL